MRAWSKRQQLTLDESLLNEMNTRHSQESLKEQEIIPEKT